jgi:hypothetical protein
MSGQGPTSAHKMRRNVSPPQRQGPMKAVKPFILKSSPSRSPSSPCSLTLQRRSPVTDSRHSPDRRSPGPSSPGFKGIQSESMVSEFWHIAMVVWYYEKPMVYQWLTYVICSHVLEIEFLVLLFTHWFDFWTW